MSLRGITESWTPSVSDEGTVYIGNERGTWPLVFLPSELHAARWMGESEKRRLWVADVKVLYEVEYVPPGEARVRPKGGGS